MSDEPQIQTGAQAIIDFAVSQRGGAVIDRDTDSVRAFVVPQGGRLVALDPEQFADQPRRHTGVVHPATVDAFAAYVSGHHTDATTVWWDVANKVVEAVFDDHTKDDPAWGDYRAILSLRETPEWAFWMKSNGVLMDQAEFAEKIEDGAREIVDPDAATMLEIAASFQASTAVSFRQATRLQSGTVQIKYDEEIQAQAGKTGQLEVPSVFLLALTPFYGEQPYEVTARLRYRINGGHLKIGYRIERPDRVITDCIEGIAARLESSLPAGLPVYSGTPRDFDATDLLVGEERTE